MLICGGYYVAEHSLQNWFTSYGSEYLGCTVSKSAFYLSLFFGGVIVGRLIFAPIVQKFGVFRSMRIWSLLAAVLYIVGFSLGKNGIWFIVAAGLAFSILYSMLVLLIGEFFDTSISGAATGFILSVATIFDVLFNACFGSLVEAKGYGTAILLLPAAACLMAVLLYVLRFSVKHSVDIK